MFLNHLIINDQRYCISASRFGFEAWNHAVEFDDHHYHPRGERWDNDRAVYYGYTCMLPNIVVIES